MAKTLSATKRGSAVQTPLETYLREINETALLNADEEKELAVRIGRMGFERLVHAAVPAAGIRRWVLPREAIQKMNSTSRLSASTSPSIAKVNRLMFAKKIE